MKKAYLLGQVCLAVLALLVCMPRAGAVTGPKTVVAFAKLTGGEVVPANSSSGTGLVTFQLSRNWDTLWIIGSITGTTTPVTGVKLHLGPRGANGPLLVNMDPFRNGNKIYAQVTGFALTPAVINAVIKGQTYVSVESSTYPNGELRGQVVLSEEYSFHGPMDPSQEVGAVGGGGIGLTVIQIGANKKWLELHSLFRDLTSNVTAAHLNFGRRGTNGPLAVNLTQYVQNNNRIDVKLELEDLPAGLLDSLLAGNVYINIITPNYPDGEIRGQLIKTQGLGFFTQADAAQETENVVSNGIGLGFVGFTSGLDSAFFLFITDQLNNDSPLTAAHLHRGPIGVSGPIIVDLVPFIRGFIVAGTVTGSQINRALITDLIDGNVYFNGHTRAYPNGEVRGQMKTFLRTSFGFDICGGQEIQAANPSSNGAGLVSVAYDSSNLRFFVNVDNLTGPISASHFHRAVQGVNGPIVKNIHFNNRFAEGSWDNQADTPLTRGFVQDLLDKKIYVNVHTSAYPNGELRGQVVRGAGICATSVGINEQFAFGATVSTYPNPVNGMLYLTVNGEKADQLALMITDLQGRKVLSNAVKMTPGSNRYTIDASILANGMYILTLTDSQGAQHVQKISKQ